MKRFSSLLLTAAVAVATSFSAIAQTADEVVQKHLTAIGGADAWRKVNTLTMKGAVKTQSMEIPITITTQHNTGMRMEFSVMGMDNYTVMTPTAGWNYMPAMGQSKPEAMTAEQIKMAADELDIQNDLVDYAKKGHTVELQGKEDVEGTECYKLRMKKKSGSEVVYYIDPATNYIIKSTEKATVDGKEEEVSTTYGDYKKIDTGIVMPMSVEGPNGPVTFTSIEVNKPVDAKIFEPSKS